MAYVIKRRDDLAERVRLVALSQVEGALQRLAAPEDFDATVHQLRKATKKLRALLRLVRPAFKPYAEENAAFRQIAGSLAGARDAAVLVETLAGLVAEGHADLTPEICPAIAELEARLRTRATHLRAQMDETALLALATERFAAAGERIPRWRFADDGSGIVLPGFERVYGRFRDGLGAVHPDAAAETIHDWRKSATAHWYHVRLFTPAAPDVLGPRAAVLGRLGDMLGDHHNLAVLSDQVEQAMLGDEATQAALLELIAARQRGLLADSLHLGAQLAAEKPRALGRRLRAYLALLPEAR